MTSYRLRVPAALLSIAISSLTGAWASGPAAGKTPLQVGAAAADIETDDSMPLAGGIFPRYVKGQEGKIRAVAVVVSDGKTNLCIVSVDVVALYRDLDDAAIADIHAKTGIPSENVLINATHTHSAPASISGHSVKADPVFLQRTQQAIVRAAVEASQNLANSRLYFALGQEATVGENSRLLLSDGTIYWIGPHDDAVRPTGPFDTQLPVLAFKNPDGKLQAMIFNHSTHNIGSLEPKRSPAFYGLAAQQLESELGGVTMFLIGAAASSHVVTPIPVAERVYRIHAAVKDAYSVAEPREVSSIESHKEEFTFQVRHFDEAKEQAAVTYYCKKRATNDPDGTIENFRKAREIIGPHQGENRKTWIQVMRIGDIAFVAMPGEYFTSLGMDIKRRSPFRYTYIVELANDCIGYIPDSPAYDKGGYQVWTGNHSYCARGTGEALADEAIRMLNASYQQAQRRVNGLGAGERAPLTSH